MKKHNLAFIDVETTGFDPSKHEMIEIGGILAKQVPGSSGGPKLEQVDEFEFKIKPENLENADPGSLRVNGYNDAEWLFAADLSSVMQSVSDKTADAIMVAQNITFDWSFLQAGFAKTGIPNKMHYHKLDLIPMVFAKFYHSEEPKRYNLGYLAEFFGVKNAKAHTALADARATFEIYQKLLEI